MALEDDLYTLFSTDASIAAAMGVPQPNVYRDAIPRAMPDSPALVFQTMPGGEFYAGAEAMNALQMKPVQFDSYHVYPNIALQISNAVRDLIKNMRQVSLANTQVQGVIITKDHGMPQEPGANGYVQRRLLLAEFWHTEGAGSVPFTPIQAPVAGSNAAYLEGVPVSTAAPTDGQGLVYDAASGTWKPGTVSGGGGRQLTITATADPHVFTLSGAPSSVLLIVRNGEILQSPGDYTVAALSVTFVLAPQVAELAVYTF